MKKWCTYLVAFLAIAFCALPAAGQGPLDPPNGEIPCVPPFCGPGVGNGLGPKRDYPPEVPGGGNICWVDLDIENPRDCTGWGYVAEGCTLGAKRLYWLAWDQFQGCRINCSGCDYAQGGPVSSLVDPGAANKEVGDPLEDTARRYEDAAKALVAEGRFEEAAGAYGKAAETWVASLEETEQKMAALAIGEQRPLSGFEQRIEGDLAAGESLESAWQGAVNAADLANVEMSSSCQAPEINSLGGPFTPQVPDPPDFGVGGYLCYNHRELCSNGYCLCQRCCYWIIVLPPPLFTVTTYSCSEQWVCSE